VDLHVVTFENVAVPPSKGFI